MGIYETWLPGPWAYTAHLLLWMLPIILLQWLGFCRILRANLKPILLAALIIGCYLCLTDIVAVYYGVWHFDDERILGFSPGGVPIEEWGFFFLTALLVAQSFVLFLPERLRLPTRVAADTAED